jgi:hypothetical protein
MRRIAATFILPMLITGSLMGSFQSQELRQLPNLIAHYDHHRTEHGQPELTFIEFLLDHFLQSTPDTDPEHDALPLFGSIPAAQSFVPSMQALRLQCIESPQDYQQQAPRQQEFPDSGSPTDVFQPPRYS